jgi:RNA polymerase sigma-70 factor (ECF subfamily)
MNMDVSNANAFLMETLSIESGREVPAISKALSLGELSDEQLIVQMQENQPDALQGLFVRYSKMIFVIAFRILHDRGEAEELVQDVFIHLLQRGRQFDPARGTAKAWIVQIAYHRALDRKAYLQRRAFYASAEVSDDLTVPSEGQDLEGIIGDRENIALIRTAFGALTAEQRLTLQLHFLSGLELREIAIRLNDSLGNVRHHLYRGLSRLRKHTTIQTLQRERLSNAKITKLLGNGTREPLCS